MKVLVACEFSGIVRDAFTSRGHYAVSCDLLPTERPGLHYQGDVGDLLEVEYWDLIIAHPPCTDLAVSGAAWFERKRALDPDFQNRALDFVRLFMNAPCAKICIENPVSIISSQIRKPDQIIQPYQFGHMEMKKTCLWLKGLPPLVPTRYVYDEMMMLPKSQREKNHYCSPGPLRGLIRSRTYAGIAAAMADQWGRWQ